MINRKKCLFLRSPFFLTCQHQRVLHPLLQSPRRKNAEALVNRGEDCVRPVSAQGPSKAGDLQQFHQGAELFMDRQDGEGVPAGRNHNVFQDVDDAVRGLVVHACQVDSGALGSDCGLQVREGRIYIISMIDLMSEIGLHSVWFSELKWMKLKKIGRLLIG